MEHSIKVIPWQEISRTPEYRGLIFDLHRVEACSLQSGKEGVFEVMESGDWVNVIALTEEENVVLVRQYRHGNRQITLEIPGGGIEKGETPLQAAKRELAEETGYLAESMEEIGRVETNPAIQTNSTYTFLAKNARLCQAQQPDPNEEIEVVEMPLDDIWQALRDGTITHSLVFAAFMHLSLFHRGV